MRDLIYAELKYCLISRFKAAITEKLFEGQKNCLKVLYVVFY